MQVRDFVSVVTSLVVLIAPIAWGLDFTGERIDITIITTETFNVEGAYYFKTGISDSTVRIGYPFAVDNNVGYPVDIRYTCSGQTRFLPRLDTAFMVMDLKMSENHVCTLNVSYTQPCKGGIGRYILTSTVNWGKPLIAGIYSIRCPKAFLLTYLSYPADSVADSDGRLIYVFNKTNFLPDRDLVFKMVERQSY